jgi:hypothetical protein
MAATVLPIAGVLASHRDNVVHQEITASISFTSSSSSSGDDDDSAASMAANMVPHVPKWYQHEQDLQDMTPSCFDEHSKKDENVRPISTRKAESPKKKVVKVISSAMSFRVCVHRVATDSCCHCFA